MVIFNSSNYEKSLLHILENTVLEAMSDAGMILHTMVCCTGIMRGMAEEVYFGWSYTSRNGLG